MRGLGGTNMEARGIAQPGILAARGISPSALPRQLGACHGLALALGPLRACPRGVPRD